MSRWHFPFSSPLERRSTTIILPLAAVAKATEWLGSTPQAEASADATTHTIC